MSAQPDTTRITAAIYMIDVLIVVGRYLPIIAAGFAAISVGFAVYDFMTLNIGWAVFSTILAVGGIIFVIQLLQRHNIHSYDYQSHA